MLSARAICMLLLNVVIPFIPPIPPLVTPTLTSHTPVVQRKANHTKSSSLQHQGGGEGGGSNSTAPPHAPDHIMSVLPQSRFYTRGSEVCVGMRSVCGVRFCVGGAVLCGDDGWTGRADDGADDEADNHMSTHLPFLCFHTHVCIPPFWPLRVVRPPLPALLRPKAPLLRPVLSSRLLGS